jgi:hypothetical protein
MEEITKLKSELAECRRHSDNHRRSRDYHKEQSAKLRKQVEELSIDKEFWEIQHSLMEEDYQEAHRHHHGWMTFAVIVTGYAIAMTVLFAWCIRL